MCGRKAAREEKRGIYIHQPGTYLMIPLAGERALLAGATPAGRKDGQRSSLDPQLHTQAHAQKTITTDTATRKMDNNK